MTTQRFYLLASAVLSLLLASATAAHASTSVSHVNGPNAAFFFCQPESNPTICVTVSVFTNEGAGGTNSLTLFYDFEDIVNGIDYFGNGQEVPHSVLVVTGQSATLNVNIDTLSNACEAFDPTGTCTPLSSGNITASWTVNGIGSFSSDGSNTQTSPGFSSNSTGHSIEQSAHVRGTIFGVNFDNQDGFLGRNDIATITLTTTH